MSFKVDDVALLKKLADSCTKLPSLSFDGSCDANESVFTFFSAIF